MKSHKLIFLVLFNMMTVDLGFAKDISFTMDDPTTQDSLIFSAKDRNTRILAAFDQFKIKGALFVCGKRIDSDQGREFLQAWDQKDHLLANHSYSHHHYNSQDITFEIYRDDFLKAETLLEPYKNFTKLYRFPYLKEGETAKKRDDMRAFLKSRGYGQGYVTIDASDWYIQSRLLDKLKENPHADKNAYRDFYLQHIWNRALYYDNLAQKVYGKNVKHTLVIHHNDLNALFLKDLMLMFQKKDWKLISAKKAFKDPIFDKETHILPAGESIFWALAKESGKFDQTLRYPAEDGPYEKDEIDKLGL